MRRQSSPGHRRSRLAPAPGPSPPAPTLTGLTGRSITTVAPSTTSAALTSITTGLPPGEHGVVGYRVAVDNDVMNVLSWRTKHGMHESASFPRSFNRTRRFVVSARSWCRTLRLRHRLHPGPPGRRPSAGMADPADVAGRGPASVAAGEPSSTPTTTASTRSPTSSALASTTTPSSRPSTGWSPTCCRCCRVAPPSWSLPITAWCRAPTVNST